jgi:pimeloyl-ACP methyl ester carboxylesterase
VERAKTTRELSVGSGDVELAGTLWLPLEAPSATVLMHPGSGPSDRDNDVLFPPIREHLLDAGFAVASFDKRGVGGSSGRWEDAGIVEQADDALAAAAALRADEGLGPVGIFGHSQGGWVAVEAAGRSASLAFVITNSGPGVTPAEQERYSALTYLRSKGLAAEQVEQAMRDFDLLVEMMREGVSFDRARERIEAESLGSAYDELDLPFVPEDEAVWDFACAILDYEPSPALERIRVPVLALFGGDDTIVPVAESVAVYRATVRPELLTVSVFPGADHRVQVGDPPRMAEGYLDALSSFVATAVT